MTRNVDVNGAPATTKDIKIGRYLRDIAVIAKHTSYGNSRTHSAARVINVVTCHCPCRVKSVNVATLRNLYRCCNSSQQLCQCCDFRHHHTSSVALAVHVSTIPNVRLKSSSAASSDIPKMPPPHSIKPQPPESGIIWSG